jgi:hypothetical protein
MHVGWPMEASMDRTLVQEFARKLFGHYTSGILTLMVDIGHRTGLFEALQAGGTSDEIAERAGLDERYVREWLGAVATGGIAPQSLGPSHCRRSMPSVSPAPRAEISPPAATC